MGAIRFLLDENVDPLFRQELLRLQPEVQVWRVGDIGAPPTSTLDPDILIWCEQQSFILVTNNRRSMPAHLLEHLAHGRHVPGILIMNPAMSVGETIEKLVLIWGASERDEYSDRISFLPLSS